MRQALLDTVSNSPRFLDQGRNGLISLKSCCLQIGFESEACELDVSSRLLWVEEGLYDR